jgi:hypothetical protein
MKKKYLSLRYDEVFSEEFNSFMLNALKSEDGLTQQNMQLTLNRIEDFEIEHNFELVGFIGSFIIFKRLS